MKQIFITANRVKAEICRKLAGIGKKDISVIENGEKLADRRSKLLWFHY